MASVTYVLRRVALLLLQVCSAMPELIWVPLKVSVVIAAPALSTVLCCRPDQGEFDW